MAKFLALYIGTANDEEKARRFAPGLQRRGRAAWGWTEENASAIVDQGGPLGHTKAVDRNGIYDAMNQTTGYIIVEAAARLKITRTSASFRASASRSSNA